MIRSILISTALMSLCSYLQSTVVHGMALWGVIPDFALIVLIYISIKNGSTEGQLSGFLSGITADVISSSPLGFNVFIKTVIGFVYGVFKANIFIDILFAPFIMAFLATLMKALLSIILSIFFANKVAAYSFFGQIIWLEALYNSVMAPFVFGLLTLIRPLIITERNRA